jgi:cell wall-associated NlpC family hydrolase
VRPAPAPAPAPAGAPTDAEVQADLEQAFGTPDAANRASLTRDGLAQPPPSAPRRLRALINGANQVARKPYVYGGGHGGGPEGVFTDSAYDCSGSISYALATAGFIESPMASGPMMSWGRPGPGKWVTIYANAGHAYMVVAGLRFDTSGRAERDTRWQPAMRPGSGFVARHPPGL